MAEIARKDMSENISQMTNSVSADNNRNQDMSFKLSEQGSGDQ